ncbi:MAG TPA: alpha/beta hydrolase [Candidatus Sulfotelmatobacter sp.]|nr:alpha/beta hydrolase [Candidatus Sulfotelmatobacter sp.]
MRVVVGDARLETLRLPGDPARPTIVLLHEGLGSVALWRDFPQQLAARTRCAVVAYSRRGYGASDPLAGPREPDYMQREATEVLPSLLDALAVERPILFGHSDGASIAIVYAGAFPDRVSGLVLEAPHVFVEEISLRSIAAARAAWERGDLRARLSRYHTHVEDAFRGWNDAWLDPRFRGWNIEADAARITCPVLIVQGEADEYGTLAQVESIAARVPLTQALVIPGAGHSPHRDAAEKVLTRVATFVDTSVLGADEESMKRE